MKELAQFDEMLVDLAVGLEELLAQEGTVLNHLSTFNQPLPQNKALANPEVLEERDLIYLVIILDFVHPLSERQELGLSVHEVRYSL